MRTVEKRVSIPMGAVVLAALLVVVMTLGSHSAVADPSGPVPNPGHLWTEIQGHGDDADGVYVSTQNNEAFEIRVNDGRALRLEPKLYSPNVIGGHKDNSVTSGAYGAAICGGGYTGNTNRVTDNYGTVGGGSNNQAGDAAVATDDAPFNTVGGGGNNVASAGEWFDPYYIGGATVGGGYWNEATGVGATVGGGLYNDAAADYATIAGGASSDLVSNPTTTNNNVSDDYGAIGGGGNNQAGDPATAAGNEEQYATVGGGGNNTASGPSATVGGGIGNDASSGAATVSGGQDNLANGIYATVGGGGNNDANGYGATVGGGDINTASAEYATVGGGRLNEATAGRATVGGGDNNTASDVYATICGGRDNTASGTEATVGGGRGNEAAASYATISGGGESTPGDTNTRNLITDEYGTIGGGGNNQAGDPATTSGAEEGYATVGGGNFNTAIGWGATIGGGDGNTASGGVDTVGGGSYNTTSGQQSTVGGGRLNDASGMNATIGGGFSNAASGTVATVGGGWDNTASGSRATIPGGSDNTAAGDYSFAAGRRANATNPGCFVWADSTDADYTCSSDDRFKTRANGGVRFDVNNSEWVEIRDDGTNLMTTSTGAYLTLAGVWGNASDVALKENFTPVDGQEVLASVAAMPISTWNSKAEDPSITHMGPTAQDFYDAFALGASETSIGTLDADGVALAAIQGLYELSQEQEARIDALEARVTALEGGAPVVREAPAEAGSESLLSSMMPTGWLLLVGLFVVSGLVVAQRRLAGGR